MAMKKAKQPNPPAPGSARKGAGAPKNSTGKDQPVRVGQKAKQGPKGIATASERAAIIKQANKVFGKGNFMLGAYDEGQFLAAYSKTKGNKASVQATDVSNRSILNPRGKKTKVITLNYGGSGGPASRKK